MNITQAIEDWIRNKPSLSSRSKFALRDFAIDADRRIEIPREVTKTTVVAKKTQIAFISQFAGNYSGGRYYTFEIACALADSGLFDVTLYCDNKIPFLKDFIDYTWPKICIVDIESLNVDADFYIGSPVLGSERACELAIKYKKPVYSLVFDSLPLMKKIKESTVADVKDRYWEKLVKLWTESNCKMIACSDMTRRSVARWIKKPIKDMVTIYPAVNSRVLSQVPDYKRENRAVFVSRLVPHKNLDHVFEAIQQTDWKLDVITDTGTAYFWELVRKYKMKNQVKLHEHISDFEKFKIMKKAKIMVNASTFEGAGIWLEEAQACGLTTVCYEWPTLRELDRYGYVYFADYNNKIDFLSAFRRAVGSYTTQRKMFADMFYFDDYMVPNVENLFRKRPKIGVAMIALNEEKYIGASLKALIRNPNIYKIAVVEGADRKFAHAATKKGLSVDHTEDVLDKIVGLPESDKVVVCKYGWAENKSELRNKCIELLGKDIDWLLVVDADEVYKQEDLNKLAIQMERNPDTEMFYYRHHHFWKRLDRLAVGGQWDKMLPRCFKFADKTFRFQEHQLPMRNKKGYRLGGLSKTITLNDIYIYHYGAMKSEKEVLDKLKYYKDRDPNLNVVDTFSNWKPGKPTQWTHGGGVVKSFEGEHPDEIKELLNI